MTTHVTVEAIAPRIAYIGDGFQTDFPFPFLIFTAPDLEVYVGETRLTTGYSVAGAGQTEGGTVTLSTPPALGVRVLLRRKLVIRRVTNFQEGGAFRASTINRELDYLTAALQELETELKRTVHLPPATQHPGTLTLPPASPGKAIGWSEDGTRLVNDPTDFTSTVQTVQHWAQNADDALASVLAATVAANTAVSTAAASATSAQTAASLAQGAQTAAELAAATATSAHTQALSARTAAEAHASDAAASALLLQGDRKAALGAAHAATAAALDAAAQATEALARLDTVDLALWMAQHASRRAEAVADQAEALLAATTTTLPHFGITPGATRPNWAWSDT